MIPFSTATLQRWEHAGVFAKRFHISGNGAWQNAFWKEDEVLQWLKAIGFANITISLANSL